jgi:hypothetical protein
MENGEHNNPKARLGPGGWAIIIVLVALLVWAAWYAIRAWNAMEGITISTTGWIFIVIGILLTVGLGAGLMALVFYSSRKDYDR